MELLVVGAGDVGRWFATSVAEVADPTFADIDADAAAAAADAVGGDTAALDGEDHFDAVAVAVPISATEETIAAQAFRAERAVVDLSGVMTDPVAAMRGHAPARERASLHPLFAPEYAPGTVAVVPDATGPATDTLLDALADDGNDLFETTPEEHDRAMETVQARAHAAVLAFGLAAEEIPDSFHTPVSRALTDLVDRVAGGSPSVYAEIQAAFDGAEDVATAAEQVADADREAFERLYREARDGGGSDDEP